MEEQVVSQEVAELAYKCGLFPKTNIDFYVSLTNEHPLVICGKRKVGEIVIVSKNTPVHSNVHYKIVGPAIPQSLLQKYIREKNIIVEVTMFNTNPD
jgi:hypothetical protein